MKLPNNYKYLLYIKTAKTGGTSFVDFLEKISKPKYFKRVNGKRVLDEISEGDIIILYDDNVSIFKKKYNYIFNNSYKILISRNPYDKIISCYNYHPFSKDKLLIDLLENKEYIKYDSSKVDFKLHIEKKLWNYYSFFSHFYLLQTNDLIENNKLLIDKVITFENLNNEIYDLFKVLDINTNNIELKHLNKTIEKKQILLSNKEVELINKRFYNDFKYLDYEFKILDQQ